MKIILTLLLLLSTCIKANSTDTTIKTFVATAFCHGSPRCTIRSKGITATGTKVAKGVIAVDKRVIKLGSKVQIVEPKEYAGTYRAEDTGGKIKGNRIDIWMDTQRKAMTFGKRTIKLIILKG